ncbi:MAG: hypothetical protein O3A10_05870 [Chloroflexi bacterium]|nr:hypothetical protein [Chloroflexota bacterium]MDA1145686.1 hypothetical protein [Chloroflexota bacterium]
MADIECDALLTAAEVERVVGVDVTPVGRIASSCYWSGNGVFIQLVFNTSDGFARWRSALLASFTEDARAVGFESWADPRSESVAAFGPDRGVIVHGVDSRADALALLRLALGRLGR